MSDTLRLPARSVQAGAQGDKKDAAAIPARNKFLRKQESHLP
ncbi:hypothetical protein [Aureitalea sp. L0-47]|nr:hypothetical protein [Aureitalea sp. L0-47]